MCACVVEKRDKGGDPEHRGFVLPKQGKGRGHIPDRSRRNLPLPMGLRKGRGYVSDRSRRNVPLPMGLRKGYGAHP